jgi:hypothetical protein
LFAHTILSQGIDKPYHGPVAVSQASDWAFGIHLCPPALLERHGIPGNQLVVSTWQSKTAAMTTSMQTSKMQTPKLQTCCFSHPSLHDWHVGWGPITACFLLKYTTVFEKR